MSDERRAASGEEFASVQVVYLFTRCLYSLDPCRHSSDPCKFCACSHCKATVFTHAQNALIVT